MARIFLSPSTQLHNAYKTGGNERDEMHELADLTAGILTRAGHTVQVATGSSAGINAAQGNAWKADWYVAIHTNAGGGKGTEVWYYTRSKSGKRLADAIYARLAPATIAPDRGVKASLGYIELRQPHMPSVIIECEFHDYAAGSDEIKTHHAEYAAAIAQGILDVVGGTPATPPAPTTKPPVKKPMPLLKQGASGTTVRVLQSALAKMGYRLVVDGSFGPKTAWAVRRFQASRLLLPDGVVGPKTWAKLGYK